MCSRCCSAVADFYYVYSYFSLLESVNRGIISRAERQRKKEKEERGIRTGGKKLTSQKGRYQTPPGIQLPLGYCRGQSSGFIGVFGTSFRR